MALIGEQNVKHLSVMFHKVYFNSLSYKLEQIVEISSVGIW